MCLFSHGSAPSPSICKVNSIAKSLLTSQQSLNIVLISKCTFFFLSTELCIAFSFNTYCCGTMKFSISDGEKEGKEVTSELVTSVRDSRFPHTPVYNSHTVEFFLGAEILGELLAQHYLRITARRVIC